MERSNNNNQLQERIAYLNGRKQGHKHSAYVCIAIGVVVFPLAPLAISGFVGERLAIRKFNKKLLEARVQASRVKDDDVDVVVDRPPKYFDETDAKHDDNNSSIYSFIESELPPSYEKSMTLRRIQRQRQPPTVQVQRSVTSAAYIWCCR